MRQMSAAERQLNAWCSVTQWKHQADVTDPSVGEERTHVTRQMRKRYEFMLSHPLHSA